MGPLVLALLVATAPLSPDAGIAPEAPLVVRLTSGAYLFQPEAFNAVDVEMKRLQEVERAAKAEEKREKPWLQVILVSVGVGLAVGLATGVAVGKLLDK